MQDIEYKIGCLVEDIAITKQVIGELQANLNGFSQMDEICDPWSFNDILQEIGDQKGILREDRAELKEFLVVKYGNYLG